MEKIEKLIQFLEQNPEDEFLRHALALEYVKKGDDQLARKYFEDILAKNPGYVGSYYHLAKLLERAGEELQAADCYRKGMEAATMAGDHHSYNELRSALEQLEF
jgi:Tfp pilus assembly protein PilF